MPLVGAVISVVESRACMLGRASSLLSGCHSPVRDRLCSTVVKVNILRVGFDKALLPVSVCFGVHQEMNAGAGGGCGVTGNLCITHAGIQGAAENQPKIVPLSPLCLSQT